MVGKTEAASTSMIHQAMLGIMAEVGYIEKSKKVEGFGAGYKYRGIDQVYEAVHPLMVKHGVFMTAEVLHKSREERSARDKNGNERITAFTSLRMRYHFRAADGSSVSTEAEGEGMDSGDKSANKAMAVAHKYAILQAFCVPTEQTDDPDAEVHQLQAQATPQAPALPEVDSSTGIRIQQAVSAAASVEAIGAIINGSSKLEMLALKASLPEAYAAVITEAQKRRQQLTTTTE